jgi:2-keto-3-deoxy-L-arabinonate dehydratase
VSGDPDRLAAAQRRHESVLPLIVFLNHNLQTQLCYGKRLLAWRMGVAEVHPRKPSLAPTEFGLRELRRLARPVLTEGA